MNWNGIEVPDKNIYFQDEDSLIYCADCREILPSIRGVSAVVTDPPYGLGFMNKEWDNPAKEGKSPTTAPFSQSMRPGLPIGGAKEGRWFQEWCYEWAKLLLECCLPGAPLLSFGGTRTSHRMVCAIEDAGWQIRDCILYAYDNSYQMRSFLDSLTEEQLELLDKAFPSEGFLAWNYGSGFPKSLSISKAIDKRRQTDQEEFAEYIKQSREHKKLTLKQMNEMFGYAAGCNWWEASGDNFRFPNWCDYQRLKKILGLDDRYDNYLRVEVGGKVGEAIRGNAGFSNEQVPRPWKEKIGQLYDLTAPATPEAKLWEGYGTALKPAYEPIIVAMKPIDGTFANNALKWGVAGLNIDGCRISFDMSREIRAKSVNTPQFSSGIGFKGTKEHSQQGNPLFKLNKGRFPANFIHDGSQEVMELFPNTKSGGVVCKTDCGKSIFGKRNVNTRMNTGDSGSAARFFYCAKASRAERDAGLEDMPLKPMAEREGRDNTMNSKYTLDGKPTAITSPARNNHPTVKPLALMTYLCKLVKMPEYNLILDPFCGSGTTLLACKKLGIKAIGIDSNKEYCEIAAKRYKGLDNYR